MASPAVRTYRESVARMDARGLSGFISAAREHIRTDLAAYPRTYPATRRAMVAHFALMVAAARAECRRRALALPAGRA